MFDRQVQSKEPFGEKRMCNIKFLLKDVPHYLVQQLDSTNGTGQVQIDLKHPDR
jgi:hypothetical protein